MAVKIADKYIKKYISEDDISSIRGEILSSFDFIKNKNGEGSDFLGWYALPDNYDKEEFARVKSAAEKIKRTADILIVIGIGGSYLGARSAIEFLKSPMYNSLTKDTPEIYFAGNSISTVALNDLLKLCESKDVCVNVISKSGTTLEPAVAFRVFRKLLIDKYGKDGARERIFVTTDKKRGALKQLADESGYECFTIPDDIGGRYSVLTSCGLLPIAAAGCDIDRIMLGAKAAMDEFNSAEYENNECLKYAAYRNLLYRRDKKIEILAAYEPSLTLFAEWWKQLYGESEGKDGKALFPASVIFSTDLHSLGQIIQQGERNIFETVIDLKNSPVEITVESDDGNLDGLNYIAGKSLHDINRTAMTATAMAHTSGEVPNLLLELDALDEFNYGYLVYFFELACGVSGYTLGVNPFNQPGVENYKNNMFALLGREGEKFDAIRKEIKL